MFRVLNVYLLLPGFSSSSVTGARSGSRINELHIPTCARVRDIISVPVSVPEIFLASNNRQELARHRPCICQQVSIPSSLRRHGGAQSLPPVASSPLWDLAISRGLTPSPSISPSLPVARSCCPSSLQLRRTRAPRHHLPLEAARVPRVAPGPPAT